MSDSQFKISKTGNSYILYDADIITDPDVSLFDVDYHTKQQAQQNNSTQPETGGIGRAKVVYFSQGDRSYVLKHYYRGGAVAKVMKDRYMGLSVLKSRAFREFRLLKKMHGLGLPVPVAVAAHAEKSLLSYRADLITQELKDTATLADVLTRHPVSFETWQSIGACIRRFHDAGVYHADLNVRNILISKHAEIYLLDFDNSFIRLGSESWKMANIARLRRSLDKFTAMYHGFNFEEADWTALLAGYGNSGN